MAAGANQVGQVITKYRSCGYHRRMVAVAGPRPLLLERDAELARLGALLGQAYAGSGSVVTITGGRGCAQLVSAARKLAAS